MDRRGGAPIGFIPGGEAVNNAQVSIDAPVSRCNRSLRAGDVEDKTLFFQPLSDGCLCAGQGGFRGAAEEHRLMQAELQQTGTASDSCLCQ